MSNSLKSMIDLEYVIKKKKKNALYGFIFENLEILITNEFKHFDIFQINFFINVNILAIYYIMYIGTWPSKYIDAY